MTVVEPANSVHMITVVKQEPKVIVKNEPIIIEARRPTQLQVSRLRAYTQSYGPFFPRN